MAIYPKVNGAHKEMTNGKVKIAGAWKQAKKLFTKVNGVWKEAWSNGALGKSVYHEWTQNGTIIDKYPDMPTGGVIFNNVILKGYRSDGSLIATNTISTADWDGTVISLTHLGATYGSLVVTVDTSAKTISYQAIFNNSATVKMTLEIGNVQAKS